MTTLKKYEAKLKQEKAISKLVEINNKMTKKNAKETVEQMVSRIDFPHLRDKTGKWLKTGAAPALKPGFAFERLCSYARQLRELGMSDVDIACMFSDLYWDSVSEYDLNKKPVA
jgi:hypothetical protein